MPDRRPASSRRRGGSTAGVRVLYGGREAGAKSLLSLLAWGWSRGGGHHPGRREGAEEALAALKEVAMGQ